MGSSLMEVLLLGLVFLAPLIWGLTVLAGVHESALAATAAAREAGTEAARAATGSDAESAVEQAVAQAFRDQGVEPSLARVRLDGTQRFDRGAFIEVEISVPVSVFRAPFLGAVSGPSIWIRARHVAQVDPFGSRP